MLWFSLLAVLERTSHRDAGAGSEEEEEDDDVVLSFVCFGVQKFFKTRILKLAAFKLFWA